MLYRILAHWDSEARVWWAESTDVKGLVAEAGTLEELLAELRGIVPDLLALNHGPAASGEAAQIELVADRTETLQSA
jgi:hypothetical protein